MYFQPSIFLRTFASVPLRSASQTQSAIAAFVSTSSQVPPSAIAILNSPMRSVSPATSASACINTLKARSAAFPSPDSRMFKSSDSAKSPAMLNAARISLSACDFASAIGIFFSVTRYDTRSYSRCVSKLIFTVLRLLKSVSARSVTVPEDFLPVISSR